MNQSGKVAHIAVPLLGVSTGMRSFTPLAVAAWFARQGRLPLTGRWAYLGHPAAVGLLTAAALGEYVGDKLPNTPSRISPMALAGRVAFAGLLGAIVAKAARRPVAGGVALAAAGALAGSFGGYFARRALTREAGLPDLPVALVEDGLAITLAVRSLSRLTA